MDFLDYAANARGWLEVIKIDTNGDEEIVFSDKNVICSGMGATMSNMYAATGLNVSSYQLNMVQLGVCGTDALQVSTNGLMGSSLGAAHYGSSKFQDVQQGTIVYNDNRKATGEAFLVIPQSYVDKIGDRIVRWTILIDNETANGESLQEIGLFANNPLEKSPLQTFLCAYRHFGDTSHGNDGIRKNNRFSLLFRWTVEF